MAKRPGKREKRRPRADDVLYPKRPHEEHDNERHRGDNLVMLALSMLLVRSDEQLAASLELVDAFGTGLAVACRSVLAHAAATGPGSGLENVNAQLRALYDRMVAGDLEGTNAWIREHLAAVQGEILENCRAAHAAGGGLSVAAEAFIVCDFLRIPLPAWLANATLSLFTETLDPQPKRPGRTSSVKAKNEMTEVHVRRYVAVLKARADGCSWPEAYRHARTALANTPAFGNDDTMKASYQKVARARRKNPHSFALPTF